MENELHRDPATPEEIWAILRVISEERKESTRRMEETDRQLRQQIKETDKQIKQTGKQLKEFGKHLKEVDEQFNSRWGKLVESLVEGDLVALLQEKRIDVLSTHPNVKGRRNGEHYEFDILAINGPAVVVVEVKTTLRAKDVGHFLGKLDKFTAYEPVYKGKQVFGAVAYLRVEQSAEVYAEKQGLYVIRATGSSASIINDPDFQPRIFS